MKEAPQERGTEIASHGVSEISGPALPTSPRSATRQKPGSLFGVSKEVIGNSKMMMIVGSAELCRCTDGEPLGIEGFDIAKIG